MVAATAWVPHSLHELRRGLGGLSGADSRLLALAAVAFLAAAVAAAAAWLAALRACGVAVSMREVAPRYAVGSLANSLAPAPAGEVVRIALVSRLLESRSRSLTATGVCATVALVRATAIAAVFAATTGASWRTAATIVAVLACAACVAVVGRRRRGRVAHLVDAAAGLARSPRRAAEVILWVVASTGARILAAALSVAALGVAHPWSAALVIVPALEVAAQIPLTPANLGVTSAAVTLALRHRHVALVPALSSGIALHAVETLAGVGFGLAGVAALSGSRTRKRIAGAVALAAGAGILGVWVADLG